MDQRKQPGAYSHVAKGISPSLYENHLFVLLNNYIHLLLQDGQIVAAAKTGGDSPNLKQVRLPLKVKVK